MKRYTNEFKVGLFVILSIAGLFYLVYSTGKLNIKKDGYHIYAVFNEVAGLQEKAPVMLNGLEIGKIDDIKISYDNDKTEITLKLWIDKQAKIRERPVVSIKTMGLMGENYIHISSSAGGAFIAPEATLKGEPYLDVDALLANLNSTLDENKSGISRIVLNMEATSKNFEEFSDDIKRHPWKLLFKGKEKQPKPGQK